MEVKEQTISRYPNGLILREHNKKTVVVKTDIGIRVELIRIFPDDGNVFGAFYQRGKLQAAAIHLTKESVIDLIDLLNEVLTLNP